MMLRRVLSLPTFRKRGRFDKDNNGCSSNISDTSNTTSRLLFRKSELDDDPDDSNVITASSSSSSQQPASDNHDRDLTRATTTTRASPAAAPFHTFTEGLLTLDKEEEKSSRPAVNSSVVRAVRRRNQSDCTGHQSTNGEDKTTRRRHSSAVSKSAKIANAVEAEKTTRQSCSSSAVVVINHEKVHGVEMIDQGARVVTLTPRGRPPQNKEDLMEHFADLTLRTAEKASRRTLLLARRATIEVQEHTVANDEDIEVTKDICEVTVVELPLIPKGCYPCIDISPWTDPNYDKEKLAIDQQRVVMQVMELACSGGGSFHITGYGLPSPETCQLLDAAATSFFERPLTEKIKYATGMPVGGYAAFSGQQRQGVKRNISSGSSNSAEVSPNTNSSNNSARQCTCPSTTQPSTPASTSSLSTNTRYLSTSSMFSPPSSSLSLAPTVTCPRETYSLLTPAIDSTAQYVNRPASREYQQAIDDFVAACSRINLVLHEIFARALFCLKEIHADSPQYFNGDTVKPSTATAVFRTTYFPELGEEQQTQTMQEAQRAVLQRHQYRRSDSNASSSSDGMNASRDADNYDDDTPPPSAAGCMMLNLSSRKPRNKNLFGNSRTKSPRVYGSSPSTPTNDGSSFITNPTAPTSSRRFFQRLGSNVKDDTSSQPLTPNNSSNKEKSSLSNGGGNSNNNTNNMMLPHSDGSSLTLRHFSSDYCLEEIRDGSWYRVPACNAGELHVTTGQVMQMWSNGAFPANIHRKCNVAMDSGAAMEKSDDDNASDTSASGTPRPCGKATLSHAYFCLGGGSAVDVGIDPICAEGESPLYEKIGSLRYFISTMRKSF